MTERFIHETAVIGCGPRFLQGGVKWELKDANNPPSLPKNVYIGPFAIVGNGAVLCEGVVVDAYCRVEPSAIMGKNTLLVYRGTVGVGAVVGEDCVIGGSVSEGTKVGNRVRSFGKLIHTHADSTQSWDFRESGEPSPEIGDDSFVAHGALIIGGVTVGPKAYVCAGAVITRNVPPNHIAYGNNQIVHYSKWEGGLRENPLFKSDP
ncbi:MAG: DapH/DapD/GlmU-related protein [Pseudomonadota bacterium]